MLESGDAVWGLFSPVGGLELGRRDIANGLQEPATHSRVAYSRPSIPFQGPRWRTSSVLYRPMIVSAMALARAVNYA